MRHGAAILCLLLLAPPTAADDGFLTTPLTGTVADNVLRFDLSALPHGTLALRAVLRVPEKGHKTGVGVRITPVGLVDAEPLEIRPPDYVTFDATAAARAWAADPSSNKGLRIAESGGVGFHGAVLEASYAGRVAEPIRPVTGLQVIHQSGQTFVTWKENEDPVGQDGPVFADFEKPVLDAQARRRLVYRVYRHTEPITPATLGQAELAREVPEAITCWNLKAIRNTEHPNQGTPTKHSVLRPGYNLALNHVMTRYRIQSDADPLPRATGLSVFTITQAGRSYYAVTASIDGREAVAELGPGASLTRPVEETPSRFPAIIYQRTVGADPKQAAACDVGVYNSWIEPPYVNVPGVAETFIARWRDLPEAGPQSRLPLMLTTGTYGGTAAGMADPGWHGARRHVKGALTVGVTEGALWQGFHECVGTLRGYEDGVVHNYPQRRVLAAAAWAAQAPDLFVDAERVSIWGQMAHWALRHGDVFAVVMSNGHANLAIGKVPQQHGWKWGPYPNGSKNWLGVDQWEYVNLAKWVRENPTVELPYWLCWPAYGAYPSHTIGDFGFMPWPEMIHAMASTKRAFAACWSTNGPGPVGPLRELVPRIRRSLSLPAFTHCSLDSSPGDGDHADAEKRGGVNLYQLWEPETVVDEPDRWEVTLHLRDDCPWSECTTDVTPRRCRKFKAKPGRKVTWTSTAIDGDRHVQSGTATADKWGLVTLKNVRLSKDKVRIRIH
ncbi:MAG TPA: hypothetical protein VM238_06470 [Phycisphaerae bacterium]|nr:hypothetical protein [Phycisphaerae bacterium]